MRLMDLLPPYRHRTHAIPASVTNLALEATTLEPSHFRRRSMLGHRIELNPSLVARLGTLIPTYTSLLTAKDPTPFNAALNVDVAPSLMPHLAAHLAHLDESLPEHKWTPHFRIHDLQHAYGIEVHG